MEPECSSPRAKQPAHTIRTTKNLPDNAVQGNDTCLLSEPPEHTSYRQHNASCCHVNHLVCTANTELYRRRDQSVASGQSVACRTVLRCQRKTFEMRKGLSTLSLAKPTQSAATVLKTPDLFI